MAGFLQNLAAKRHVARIRRDHPVPWGLGIDEAEKHFEQRYRSVPPRSPSGIRGLMELANSEADRYIPALVIQAGGDPDQDVVQAFCTAFERRLSELFIGLTKGALLHR